MPRVAVLIAASPTRAFYSQIAVFSLALRRLPWSRWVPSVHAYIGGHGDPGAYRDWLPHLRDVEVSWVADRRFEREGDWAQSDDVFRLAPRDADVLLAMDADTLPVAPFEDVLDRVRETTSIGGVIAHYPTVLNFAFDARTSSFSLHPSPRFPDVSLRAAWDRLAAGIVDAPLNFPFTHTLMSPESPEAHRLTPFYPNFGVVFFPAATFGEVATRYLQVRPQLMDRLPSADFSGQVALTLATAAARVGTWALPMRFNFPNDPLAAEMYPEELANVVIFHYLRTDAFDRQQIFATARGYADFLALPLSGVHLAFQRAVETIVGARYPFA